MNQFRLLLVALVVIQITNANAEWASKQGPLVTRWTEHVTPKNVWTEYPRPQMVRPEWKNLNGLWQYSIRKINESKPTEWDGEILVPFCVESALTILQLCLERIVAQGTMESLPCLIFGVYSLLICEERCFLC